ncbi:MAG: hypothetical protein EU549_00915 [Promethearchaeota archaeon]|nr:MAG: hypothetical protein EU549_00915 [Candidatus Lokiarchaeota archaeon]
MNWIIKTYKFAGNIKILNKLGAKLRSNKLRKALHFFNYYNDKKLIISSENVGAGTILIFIISLILTNLCLIFFNILISLLISFIFALIISRKFYYYIINYHKIRYLNSLQFLDLVYQDFLIILNSTNSIFDAILFIANSSYPIISKDFKDIVKAINLGEKPETLLLNYIDSISNQTFRERMTNLISYNLKTDAKNKKNKEFSTELGSKYQEYTKQLDTRLTILIGINVFLPILTTTLFSFYIAINSYFILILLPFHVFILMLLKKVLLKREFFILGANDTDSNEFNELILFLSIFSNQLMMNNSPENSLIKSLKIYKGEIQEILDNTIFDLLMMDYHIHKVMDNLIDNLKSNQSKVILNLTNRMLKKDSKETGYRLNNIIDNIQSNRKIVEKRNILLKSQQFKVLILLFILSGLMGLMTNIIPLFNQFFQVFMGQEFTEITLTENSFFDLVPIILTFGVILFITSKAITSAIKFKKSYFYSIIVLFVYLLIVYGTSLFFL